MLGENAQDIQYLLKLLSKFILRQRDYYIIMDYDLKQFILKSLAEISVDIKEVYQLIPTVFEKQLQSTRYLIDSLHCFYK